MSLRSLFQSCARTRDVTVHDVASGKGAARIVDVRETSEFVGELGHIQGAELVPLATLDRAATAWNRSDEIIVVCRSGARSARAAQTLSSLGFRGISNMVGGMTARNAADLPVQRGR